MTARILPSCVSQPRRRRAHHKSRQGCAECKTRHIKCDENRPNCTNCVTSERRCSFREFRIPAPPSSSTSPTPSEAGHRSSVMPQAPGRFTVTHLACLHHAEGHMDEYMALRGSAQSVISIAISNATVAPFLLDQLLALSALHISTQDASRTLLFHHQATELQTRALEVFNQSREEMNSTNYALVFLFASLLGIHVLRETLANHRDNLSTFVEAFIRYLQLHRGVRTFITDESWAQILKSDLRPLLFLSDASDKLDKHAVGLETAKLKEFLASYECTSDSTSPCQDALGWMQWVLNLCNQDATDECLGIHAVIAWPLVISDKYIEALHQRRPEAFAVLAFYAAALHRYRQFWVFDGAGLFLLDHIYSSIGSYWLSHLDLPRDSD
ncbi:Upc2 protein [Boeremia exigua]|uniref:Upc2 protein n=1 Tax=Boeremia exigua TaxID=749465 RepID=UPI001E8DCF27|nr:Upc2 protein [Boeremia exigua]KAH6628960.1 Upc2 protein [Boeremia exigua]